MNPKTHKINSKQIPQNSKYYNEGEIPSIIKNENSFTVLSLNAQSLLSKLDQIKIYIKSLQEKQFMFDAICIQETWINPKLDKSLLNLCGYNLIMQERSCGDHGGLAIYLKADIKYNEINIPVKYHDIWECQLIEINTHTKHKILLANIYRPPRNLADNVKNFMEDIEFFISSIDANCSTILTGDFNLNLLNLGKNHTVDAFFEMMISYSLNPFINMPTRICGSNSSLIDNFYCKFLNPEIHITTGIINSGISDHCPYFLSLINETKRSKIPKLIAIYPCYDKAITDLKLELSQTNLLEKLDLTQNANPNLAYDTFHELIMNAINRHLSIKMVHFNKKYHKVTNWITYGLIKSINHRDKLYAKLKKTNTNCKTFETQKQNLKVYNNILKQAIKQAKLQYYTDRFQKYKNDMKQTWKTINEVLKRSPKQNKVPDMILKGTQQIDNKLDIANCFNSYFVNMAKELTKNNDNIISEDINIYLNDPTLTQFKFQQISTQDIIDIITDMKPKTSRDAYNLSSKIMKDIKLEIGEPLKILINQSLITGIYPERLKLAKISPIHKKNDIKHIENYRPISLLPIFSKIYEKVVHKQLQNYFEINNLFNQNQYGFRKNHSTELAIAQITDNILWEIENKQTPLSIFLDLTKAFDSIDHEIMLSKLKYYGIKNTELNFFKSYLSNREQYVDLDGTKSNKEIITTGVPQGSILGPLLFIIYINDITAAINKFKVIIYADDITLSTSYQPNDKSDILKDEFIELVSWFKTNKLTINYQKTKFMIFHSKQTKLLPPKIMIDGNQIEHVSSFNYLGITLDTNLSYNIHIESIKTSIARTMGSLNSIKRIIPPRILKQIYLTLIQPKILYGLVIWGHNAHKLHRLQKRAVRIITCSKYNAHTDPLFKELNILKITDLYNLQICKLFYKITNGYIPIYFKQLYSNSIMPPHQYNFRTMNRLPVTFCRLSQTQNCTKIKIAKTINNLQQAVFEKNYTHSLKGFACYYTTHTLDTYNTVCSIQNCYICNS